MQNQARNGMVVLALLIVGWVSAPPPQMARPAALAAAPPPKVALARARGEARGFAKIGVLRVPATAPRFPLRVARHAVAFPAAEVGRLTRQEADVVIEPHVGDVTNDDVSQKKRLIEAGEEAARAALARRGDVRL